MWIQTLDGCADVTLVGGKGANLGRLVRAGFHVPGGFVVTTAAFRAGMTAEVRAAIGEAYRAMGAGSVAVRSSATAEDMAGASMAGQYETFLDVRGEEEVAAAVKKCWASVKGERAAAYLQGQGVAAAGIAMAVVVQRLAPADAAGVMFTVNPRGRRGEMMIEASWGLGESVVSGRVQPDVMELDRETGRVVSERIGEKGEELVAGGGHGSGAVAVEALRRERACIGAAEVRKLWEVGRAIEQACGGPQDVEWAIAGGELYVLQSRPITTLGDGETERVVAAEKERLRQELAAGRGPWVAHNIAETLPHPTPLTWSVVGRFMSGAGGYGAMYREAGFEPSARADAEGFLELIAGRVYMDLSRAPEMFGADFGYGYDVEALKEGGDVSAAAPTAPRGGHPGAARAGRILQRADRRLRELANGLDRELRDVAFPRLEAWAAAEQAMDLRLLTGEEWAARWRERERVVMDEFGGRSLLPGMIGGMALADLERFLAEHFWEADAAAVARDIASGGEAVSRTVAADEALYEVGTGQRTAAAWAAAHGHRGAGEFDLSNGRWRERPAEVTARAGQLAAGKESPVERHRRQAAAVEARVAELRRQLAGADRPIFDRLLDAARRYLAFREDAKDVLMRGYDTLRAAALEAGRRLGIGDDVFFLTREELLAGVLAGKAETAAISERRRRYRAEAAVQLEPVIDGAAVETLGDASDAAPESGGWTGFGVSGGVATGPVRVVMAVEEADASGGLGEGYVLVCPSTDPSWTPLFVRAAGLVLERGGALSHGAVVAREMGLPAVVLPGATRMLQTGEPVRVDGSRGWVGRMSEQAPERASANVAAPPPVGRRERRSWRVAAAVGCVWAAYLAAFFLLPARWVYVPTMRALDAALWPVVRMTGRGWTVVLLAAAVAVVTLLVQRFFTDNRRLVEAKRRAAALRKGAGRLARGSGRRRVMEAQAAGVQWRVLLAAMVPVGILLGPMVMPFAWMRARIGAEPWDGAAGAVQVVARVDGEYAGPVKLETPPNAEVDASTPAVREMPALRPTLEKLLADYRAPAATSQPWQTTLGPDIDRQRAERELDAYLHKAIPAQAITWVVRVPAGFSGVLPVSAGEARTEIVAGMTHPPALDAATAGGGPVRSLTVVYPRANVERPFWRPLSWLGGKLGAWDAGWIGAYVCVYVVMLLALRWLLGLA